MNLPKSIKSSQLMREASYANAVLQAFIQLECVQEWVKNLYNNGALNLPYYNSSLTKDLIYIFCSLSNGMNLDSSKIILDFDVKSSDIWKKDIGKDPYHFLHYFLEILHFENNLAKIPGFNIDLYNQMVRMNINNDNAVFNQFNNYLTQTQNSFVSNNFSNIQKFMVHCPNCNYMFSYGLKKIIKFNYDELLIQRNQSQLKFGQNLELSECFQNALLAKKTKCQICNNFFGCESQQLFSTANVLIIAINRSNHNNFFRNDLNFYLNIDITQFLLNTNSENRKYKLKSVISRYNYNRYLVDIFINGNFYRIVDWKNGRDVKVLKNVNQLMEYEPHLLIYEVDYQGKEYEKMKMMQDLNTFYKMAQFFQFAEMMQQNMTLSNINQGFNQNNIGYTGTIGFNLKFLVIPQNWNGDNNNAFPITPQVTPDFTIKDTIDKFYSKLIKPRQAIIKFTFNNMDLDVNSTQTLRQLNINENSVIHALKSPNFDALKLENN